MQLCNGVVVVDVEVIVEVVVTVPPPPPVIGLGSFSAHLSMHFLYSSSHDISAKS